ncbi:hypothetical protein TPS_00727 [Trichinella pseudospiralis]
MSFQHRISIVFSQLIVLLKWLFVIEYDIFMRCFLTSVLKVAFNCRDRITMIVQKFVCRAQVSTLLNKHVAIRFQNF